MAQFPRAAEGWQICSIASPLAALCVNAVAQVLAVRASRGRNFLRCVLVGFFTGALALAAFETLLFRTNSGPDACAVSLLVNAPTYAALSYCYFGLVNLGQTSIRIRLYAEIAERPEPMPLQEIDRIYNEEAFAGMRIKRLLESGDIVEKNGRYYINRTRLALAANVIAGIRLFIIGARSEFENDRSAGV